MVAAVGVGPVCLRTLESLKASYKLKGAIFKNSFFFKKIITS